MFPTVKAMIQVVMPTPKAGTNINAQIILGIFLKTVAKLLTKFLIGLKCIVFSEHRKPRKNEIVEEKINETIATQNVSSKGVI